MDKKCFRCGHTKLLTDFYVHPRMADGHLNKCKECTKSDMHKRRHVDAREYVLAYDRERGKLPHRKENARKQTDKWVNEHPEWRNAQVKLGNAVRDGKVKPLPCMICGVKAEAHHPDYSRPLDVVWLCSSHHKQAHAIAREF
jgi:hypothetical protein